MEQLMKRLTLRGKPLPSALYNIKWSGCHDGDQHYGDDPFGLAWRKSPISNLDITEATTGFKVWTTLASNSRPNVYIIIRLFVNDTGMVISLELEANESTGHGMPCGITLRKQEQTQAKWYLLQLCNFC